MSEPSAMPKPIAIDGSAGSVTRTSRDVYELPLPAVATVLEGLNLPRYPSVPGRMRAKGKPVDASSPPRPEPRLEKLRLRLPPGQGKQAEVLGRGPEAALAVVETLRRIGVVA